MNKKKFKSLDNLDNCCYTYSGKGQPGINDTFSRVLPGCSIMKIKKLVQKLILEYRQDNPFDPGKEFIKYTKFNLIRQKELRKYFANKTRQEYEQYWAKVFELEKQNGQIMFF